MDETEFLRGLEGEEQQGTDLVQGAEQFIRLKKQVGLQQSNEEGLELEKAAYDINAAKKVLQAAKPLTAPKGSLRVLSNKGAAGELVQHSPLAGLASRPNVQKNKAVAENLFSAVERNNPGIDPAQIAAAREAADQARASVQPLADRFPQGAILKGDQPAQRGINQSLGLPRPQFTPEQHQITNSVLHGHELDEVRVAPGMGARMLGHNSPDVLLREHNRVATLPPEHTPVKEYMQNIRSSTGDARAMRYGMGIDYGNSPRISRHARKHLTNIMNNKAVEGLSGGADPVASPRILSKEASAAHYVASAIPPGLAGVALGATTAGPAGAAVGGLYGALHGVNSEAKHQQLLRELRKHSCPSCGEEKTACLCGTKTASAKDLLQSVGNQAKAFGRGVQAGGHWLLAGGKGALRNIKGHSSPLPGDRAYGAGQLTGLAAPTLAAGAAGYAMAPKEKKAADGNRLIQALKKIDPALLAATGLGAAVTGTGIYLGSRPQENGKSKAEESLETSVENNKKKPADGLLGKMRQANTGLMHEYSKAFRDHPIKAGLLGAVSGGAAGYGLGRMAGAAKPSIEALKAALRGGKK